MIAKVNIYNKIIIITASILCLTTSVFASTVAEALRASENNQSDEAVKIWSQLAASGNVTAKFNLAKHYDSGVGIEHDVNIANKWYKNATRSGLVEAYLHLNKNALSAAKGLTINFNSGPMQWLDKQDQKLYTVQLASSGNEELIKKYYLENNIQNEGGYYHYVREGEDRYALVYGVYDSVAEANVAISQFPENLRKWTPWVRNIRTLQNISK